MNKKLLIGFLILLGLGIFLTPKISNFLKIDNCLDGGGSWDYEKGQCITGDTVNIEENVKVDSHGYDELANEQNRKAHTISDYNSDLDSSDNIERPDSSIFISNLDTSLLFGIWTLDTAGPHADFWITISEFYVADYDGDGSMPYILKDSLMTIFYNDFIQKGKIEVIQKDSLVIRWNNSSKPTRYFEWKN